MHEDAMPDDPRGTIFRAYMSGALTVEAAAEQLRAVAGDGPRGLNIAMGSFSADEQERAQALLARLLWCSLREADPTFDLPPFGSQEFREWWQPPPDPE
jgi:hypothetical protein